MHQKLFSLLTALSIRLQLRRAKKQPALFRDGWERQITAAVGTGENHDELERALDELGQTLYAGSSKAQPADDADSVREIATLLSDIKICAGGCGLFEFERTVEAASFRAWDTVKALEAQPVLA